MTERLRVGEHVEVLRGPEGGRYPYGNPVVVTGPERTVLVDAALGVDPPPVDAVLLSHYHEDHVVGLGRPGGDRPAPETWIHERDLLGVRSWHGFGAASGFTSTTWVRALTEEFGYEPLPHARGFEDDTVFELGGAVRVRVVPLPGHTAGHCGFVIEPDKVFFLGDVDLSGFGPFYGDASASLRDTVASIDRCADIDARVYLTYHHKGPYEDRPSFLQDLRAYRAAVDRRREQVLELLLDRPRSPGELVGLGVVYRPGTAPAYGAEAEQRMCDAHLRELAADGSVRGPDADGRYHRVAP